MGRNNGGVWRGVGNGPTHLRGRPEWAKLRGQPQQKQAGLTMQGLQSWGHNYPLMPVVPALSLVPQFGQQTVQPPQVQATLRGLFQNNWYPGRPDHHPSLHARKQGLPAGAVLVVMEPRRCEQPCLAAPWPTGLLLSPRADPAAPLLASPPQYLEVRAFPLGLRVSMVLGSRANEPVSSRPHPQPLPEDRLQGSAVASCSFHSCFLFLPRLFSSPGDSSLRRASLYLALILFIFPLCRVTRRCRKA